MVYALQHYTGYLLSPPSPSAAITKEKTLFFFFQSPQLHPEQGDNWESDLDTRVQEYDFFPQNGLPTEYVLEWVEGMWGGNSSYLQYDA